MRAECPCDERQPRTQQASRALVGSALGLALGIAAALLPKCPVCVAAYLSLLGVGTAAASTIAPLLLPVGLALTVLSLMSMLVLVARRRTGRRRCQAARA